MVKDKTVHRSVKRKRGLFSRQTKGEIAFSIVNILLLLLLCVVILFPVYYMFIVSISEPGAVNRGEVSFLPIGFSLKGYRALFIKNDVPIAFMNSIVYVAVGTGINLLLTALCAYPLSRKKLLGRTAITFFIVFNMFFSAGMISRYMTVTNLHLRNTIWAIVLPGAISTMNMVIMRTFFMNIPEELHESAKLDGAGEFTILFRIVIPLSGAVFATMALFYAVDHWNSWFNALLYLDNPKQYPLQLLLRGIVIQGTTLDMDWQLAESGVAENIGINIKYAMSFIAMAPILVVYPFVQKHFVKGVMIGSLKG
ncbi:MAG: carbohydrate ABC transporter permease [Oscillospiraceae bacterium]